MTDAGGGMRALAGQVALVTGASRGVGRYIALALAAAGMHVVAAARDADRVREVPTGLRAAGGSASARVFDAADAAQTATLVGDVERECGRLDLLVNNAGINGDGTPFAGCDLDAWWRVIEVDLRAPAILCRAASATSCCRIPAPTRWPRPGSRA
jgi:NAD(P)-dependent dehydrogenase (short-subunit alcohol dehydrogenase family)